jgi:hypothetical protein
MKPHRTIRYEPARQGLVLKVQYQGTTLQTFMPKEEYGKLNSIDFEYLKECNYVLLENKIKEMT